MSHTERPQRQLHRDADWYRATYNAASGLVLLHDASKKRDKLEEAESMARELGEQIELGLIEASWPKEPLAPLPERQRAAQRLKPFLSKVEPTALILLAGVLRRMQHDARVKKPPMRSPTPQDQTTQAAEARAEVPMDDLVDEMGQTEPRERVRHRPSSQRQARLKLLTALEDRSITHPALIAWVAANLNLDYRAHYNLACYFSGRGNDFLRDGGPDAKARAGANYRRAYRELETSLVAAPLDIVDWAQKDPALKGIRDSEFTHAKFRALIDGLETGDSKSPAVDPDEAHDRLLRRVAKLLSRLPNAEVILPVGEDQPDVIVDVGRRKFAGVIRAEDDLSTAVLRRTLRRVAAIVDEQPAIEEGFLAVPDSARVSPVAPPLGIALIRASDADAWLRARVG
jgi:hypothetical protein